MIAHGRRVCLRKRRWHHRQGRTTGQARPGGQQARPGRTTAHLPACRPAIGLRRGSEGVVARRCCRSFGKRGPRRALASCSDWSRPGQEMPGDASYYRLVTPCSCRSYQYGERVRDNGSAGTRQAAATGRQAPRSAGSGEDAAPVKRRGDRRRSGRRRWVRPGATWRRTRADGLFKSRGVENRLLSRENLAENTREPARSWPVPVYRRRSYRSPH